MQIFVKRSELTGAADETVHVIASYDDNVIISPDSLGTGITVFSMPQSAIQSPAATPPSDPTQPTIMSTELPVLTKTWRNDFIPQVLSGEANRRITAAFPDYSQRNSNSEINGYITTYGTNIASWPAYQQGRKAEIDRCWQYVNDVRAKANAMTESMLPLDPTADGNWPTVISPYVPS